MGLIIFYIKCSKEVYLLKEKRVEDLILTFDWFYSFDMYL